MRHLAASPSRSDPQPRALEMCAGCWRYTELEVYQLSCCCSCRRCGHDDQRHLFAVAWICSHCDQVVDTVGVFTRWATALDARRRTLKRRELDGTSLWRGTSHTSTANVGDTSETGGV